jgi:hypothetical protein
MSKHKTKEVETGAMSALEDAVAEVESLKEEIENWRDGMSGSNLEYSSKYSELEDVLYELEEIQELEIPSFLCDVELKFDMFFSSRLPRWKRAHNVGTVFSVVAEHLESETFLDSLKSDEDKEVAEDFASELQSYTETIFNIQFPGMY